MEPTHPAARSSYGLDHTESDAMHKRAAATVGPRASAKAFFPKPIALDDAPHRCVVLIGADSDSDEVLEFFRELWPEVEEGEKVHFTVC